MNQSMSITTIRLWSDMFYCMVYIRKVDNFVVSKPYRGGGCYGRTIEHTTANPKVLSSNPGLESTKL